MTLAEAFGAAVRRLRALKGFSQEGFAHHAGISRTYMSEVERGTTNVSLETLNRVAIGLGISIEELARELEKELVSQERR